MMSPMTAAIVLLLVLALVLFIAEAHVPSGILGILGIGAPSSAPG